MRALETLRVTITTRNTTEERITAYQIMSVLEPLKAVRGVKDYGVELMFGVREQLEARLGEVPFKLQWGRHPYADISPVPDIVSCKVMKIGKHFASGISGYLLYILIASLPSGLCLGAGLYSTINGAIWQSSTWKKQNIGKSILDVDSSHLC